MPIPEFLQSILEQPWKPVSRLALWAWLVFYVAFLAYAFSAHGGFLFIDSANLVVHEGGHNLFAWFGPTMCLWGGTVLQWAVPFLLAAYFFIQRETAGFVFSLFFFFENWLYTATYMADARAQVLPLVTTGDPDLVEHDFFKIFSSLGVLNYDTKIAATVRLLGWCGMIGVTAWFALRAKESKLQLEHADEGHRFLEFMAKRQSASLPREKISSQPSEISAPGSTIKAE
ncbi:MAG TPA: hypothetical protein VMG31_09175 [Verrucomicrobiae bacterium]|nr:hypothetical protein [Verrucomicrobiae bacterium]